MPHEIHADPHGALWIDRDLAAYNAAVRPDKIACIEFKTGERLSYRELDRRANRMAGAIEALVGDARGVPLAILARNSVEFLVFFVAVHRLGAVLMPLNWRLSATELEVLLLDAEPALVIFEDEFAAPIQEALQALPTALALSMEAFKPLAESAAPTSGPPRAIGADAPFILLYTSGTTGKPKGAIITRENAFFQSLNFAFIGEVAVDSVLVCDSPMFHTVGLMAVAWTTVQRGATFAISDRFVAADTLSRLLDDELGATHYFGVPQIARALVDDPAYQPRALSRLTGFFVGGAPMPHDLIERLAGDEVKIANGFGMSETGSIMHVPLDLTLIRTKIGSVGIPGPAMQVRVVREDGSDCDDGEAGELWMRGPSVTPGYWKRPEATEAGFAGPWFKSGDIGMRDADGFHYVLDRSKDMYISGGENVYPAEVESALLRLSAIAEAAVVGVPDERWGEVGCAYVVLREGADPMSAEQLIKACGQWLAPYKRPKHVRFIAAVPRNAAGKALKAELRKRPL